ncbi:type II secretion system F family protein [Nakamurella flavida]|uniref:Type II secretion system F family protein n=1 Tax=Nakamurella flavida TaxID=363630 RepID=A0A938YQ47_9ACTN|nr:type II secretion system F family protein [Nakamurella flavida]MBM9477173.1 type II secretion system F family protein [Nakamurella flavida]MDP9780122.1 tight adherence protein B [Nakamurella flavida]
MGSLIGLVAGIGVLLVWAGLSTAPRHPRSRVRHDRMQEQLIQAGLSGVTPSQLVALQALAGVVVTVVALVVTGSVVVSPLLGAFGAMVPRLLVSRLRHRRQADLRDLWPEVVDNLTSGVRAGLSLPEALASIGVRGPEQLREPFVRFGSDYRTTGHFNRSLDALKAALADPVGDRVCESLRVAREVGGTDLGRLLTTLSTFLRDDARTRAELGARQSWSVNAARMAVAAPWLVLVLLATQRATIQAYDTPTGALILGAGAVASVGAYRLMIRIGRLPEDKRVLR